jgi:hypothetical protein
MWWSSGDAWENLSGSKLSTASGEWLWLPFVKLGNKELVEKLTRSAIYRDYVHAFCAATGMPLALRAVEHWQPALRGQKTDDPIGAMAGSSSSNHVRTH